MSKVPTEKFPDPAPTFDITIPASLQADFDKYSNGSIAMSMYPSSVTSDGKEIGTIASPMGGAGVVVTIEKRHYFVNGLDIFKAIYAKEKG